MDTGLSYMANLYRGLGGNAETQKIIDSIRDSELISDEKGPTLYSCPNCGAGITQEGSCPYCETLLR